MRVPEPELPSVSSAGNDNWLSDASLIRGVETDGTGIRLTKNNVRHEGDEEEAGAENTVTFTAPESGALETTLRLQHTRGADGDPDYLVFGAWETKAETDPGPDPKAEVVWAGSIPYVGVQNYRTGEATYSGNVLGHYKTKASGSITASDPWLAWNGTVSLAANFGTQYINGTVTATSITDITSIALKKAKITDTVSGEIAGITDASPGARNGQVGGTWHAQFFGPESAGEPTGVAGDFKATRAVAPAGTGSAGPALEIQGGFGADPE